MQTTLFDSMPANHSWCFGADVKLCYVCNSHMAALDVAIKAELPFSNILRGDIRTFNDAAIISSSVPSKRKKHSHRCTSCNAAVYCYKQGCAKPQRLPACSYCK